MRAALRFVPALAIGLGVGWLIADRIEDKPSVEESAGTTVGVPAMPSAQPVRVFGRAELREQLDEIFPLPETPSLPEPNSGKDYNRYRIEFMHSFEVVRETGRTSPYRAQWLSEWLRNDALPIVAASRGRAVNGSRDIERSFERLAAERPSYALSQAGGRLHEGFTGHDMSDAQGCRRAVLRTWLRDDPASAFLEVTKQGVSKNRAISSFNRGMTIHAMMREWGELDPAAAAAALPELPESGRAFSHGHFAESMVEGWFQRDPAAARRWIEESADPQWRTGLRELVSLLESGDPSASSDVLWQLPDTTGN
jgi:hypothetical protein